MALIYAIKSHSPSYIWGISNNVFFGEKKKRGGRSKIQKVEERHITNQFFKWISIAGSY